MGAEGWCQVAATCHPVLEQRVRNLVHVSAAGQRRSARNHSRAVCTCTDGFVRGQGKRRGIGCAWARGATQAEAEAQRSTTLREVGGGVHEVPEWDARRGRDGVEVWRLHARTTADGAKVPVVESNHTGTSESN